VNAPRQKLSARDYKHGGRRGSLDLAQYRQFGIGLAAGLAVAVVVFAMDHRARPTEVETEPRPQANGSARTDAADTAADDAAAQYDFYDMLPKFEVVVPEKERNVRRDLPAVPVEQPGTYVLQVGSYRNQPDAELVRARLGKQGIDATVQRVAVDADVWHRVRVGPFRDLARLNATRRELRAADIDAIVIRLPD
jgi:cell division protein FtsN